MVGNASPTDDKIKVNNIAIVKFAIPFIHFNCKCVDRLKSICCAVKLGPQFCKIHIAKLNPNPSKSEVPP